MDSNELRAACKLAGLKCDGPNIPDPMVVIPHWGWLLLAHSALPAYVAELLVAKVRGMGVPDEAGIVVYESQLKRISDDPIVATAEQRIRAAMAVLGGGE